MTKPMAVLFDWDGTLADTSKALSSSLTQVFAEYGKESYDNMIAKYRDVSISVKANFKNYFGADSIVELQVIPETAPEGPEGITVTGTYKGLKVSWKAHQKAKDYDLYYRKIGTGAWIKANDPNDPKYVDSDTTKDVPDGAYD